MSDDLIRPRTLKGFRDLLPDAAIARESIITAAIAVYRSYGFSPIDTPALEYSEILLGKGGAETEKQTYRFHDAGGRDVALRFDLTVPFARFAAEHLGRLGTPFKRYQVAAVWRGENPQRGRYREFVQCDFDTIGTEHILADIETLLVTHDLFVALGFERFTIRFSDRRILGGLLHRLDMHDSSVAVLRALDKLGKVGPDKVAADLEGIPGADPTKIASIVQLAQLSGGNDEIVDQLPALVGGTPQGDAGIAAVREILGGVEGAVAPGRVEVDLSIARGLDYYTGMVFETYLDDLTSIGSCCSGGRYDDLASLYTNERLPGVGGSLGVDRLQAAMEELHLAGRRSTWAPVLVTVFDEEGSLDALQLATTLRRAGVGAEVYPEPRKLGTQLKYADSRGHRVAVITGPTERDKGVVQVKNLATGEAVEVPAADVAPTCRAILDD